MMSLFPSNITSKKSSTRPEYQGPFKFLVLGDANCGKTTFLDYYCNSKCKKRIKETIGCELHMKKLGKTKEELLSPKLVEFWDLSGNSLHQPFIHVYTKNLHKRDQDFRGIIFFFDLTNKKSLLHLPNHLENLTKSGETKKFRNEDDDDDLESFIQDKTVIQLPIFIIGNKADLLDEKTLLKREAMVKEYLENIFGDNAHYKYAFVSNKMPANSFKNLDKFIEDGINSNMNNFYVYNSEKNLNFAGGYQSGTWKKVSKVENEIREIAFSLVRFSKSLFEPIKLLFEKFQK